MLLLGSTACAAGNVITLEIRALIDGRDQLIIHNNTLQWHHFENAAVGRHLGVNEPTEISTTLNGSTQLDHYDWIPDWPAPPPNNIRYEAYSSVFTGLTPAIPRQETTVSLQVIQARSLVQLIQQPSAANNYTTILQFDDRSAAGSEFYQARLTFPIPEPAALSLFVIGIGSAGLIRLRGWRDHCLRSLHHPGAPVGSNRRADYNTAG
jgi:hypothetical protein